VVEDCKAYAIDNREEYGVWVTPRRESAGNYDASAMADSVA
jgi:hypothetical protein